MNEIKKAKDFIYYLNSFKLNNIEEKTESPKQKSKIKTFGDIHQWKLLCKATSESEGYMKSTKAMEIPLVGCLVQVSTKQKNPDGSYSVAESVTLVPHVEIEDIFNEDETLYGRRLIYSIYDDNDTILDFLKD